jgi:hypothetical protein
MGGVFGGGGGGGNMVKAVEKVEAENKKPEQATQAQEEAGAKMRGAKRRGRQLLSDARLNPEMGMQETLGGGNSLG